MIIQTKKTETTSRLQVQRMLEILEPERSFDDWVETLEVQFMTLRPKCKIEINTMPVSMIVEACVDTNIDLDYVVFDTTGSGRKCLLITNFKD